MGIVTDPTLDASTSLAQFASIYVIEIARGRIKVGYSTSPKTRLAAHRGAALAHGCTPGREWVSPKGSGTPDREAVLIAFCKERARKQFQREYFTGVKFVTAVRFAADLCDDLDTLDQLDVEEGKGVVPDVVKPAVDLEPIAVPFHEAASRLGLSLPKVRRLIYSRELPVLTIGTIQRIPVAAIEERLSRSTALRSPLISET